MRGVLLLPGGGAAAASAAPLPATDHNPELMSVTFCQLWPYSKHKFRVALVKRWQKLVPESGAAEAVDEGVAAAVAHGEPVGHQEDQVNELVPVRC